MVSRKACPFCGNYGSHFAGCPSLKEIELKDRGKTNEINILTKENNVQHKRIAELERLLKLAEGLLEDDLACADGTFVHTRDPLQEE